MKITVATSKFLSACQIVANATGDRSTIPALQNIKITAIDDKIILMATNSDLGIRYELPDVNVKASGSCVVPPQKLIAILRESDGEETTLDSSGNSAKVKSGSGKYELPNFNPDDFPDLPEINTDDNHEAKSNELREAMRRTIFAADRKEGARWAVTGLLWEVSAKGGITLVATDTKRLAKNECGSSVPGNTWKDNRMIPAKYASLIERYLPSNDNIVKIAITPNAAMFQCGNWTIQSKIVEGRFPPYKDIIPKKSDSTVEVNVAEFARAIRQAAITTDEESKRVDMEFSDGKVVMTSRGAETGSGEVTLNIPYEGQKVSVGLDPQYVLEFLRANTDAEKVKIELKKSSDPVVFKTGDNSVYLVMPMG